jgi:hypothetical protein
MRDLAVVALEEVLAADLPVRLVLAARALRNRSESSRAGRVDELRQLAERLRERRRLASGLAKTNGPHESTETGTRPSSVLSKPGSRSSGAARSAPSRPYVQAW